MSAAVFFHATHLSHGAETQITVSHHDGAGTPYDLLDVAAAGNTLHLFMSPEQTRELYDALGAHLAAQETAAEAA